MQGGVSDETIKNSILYSKSPEVSEVVISTWDDDKDKLKILLDGPVDKIKIIFSRKPTNNGIGNRNLQIVSSLHGSIAANNNFIIKTRTDQYLNEYCISTIINRSDLSDAQILVAGIFPCFPFHPRDHIFAGYKNNLVKLFSAPLDAEQIPDTDNPPDDKWPNAGFYSNFLRTEAYIGTHYCSLFDQEIKNMLNDYRNYLVDFAPNYKIAINKSKESIHAFFKPLPKLSIEWKKYGRETYPIELNASNYGEYYE